MAPVGLAVRCGACQGGGWLRGWFRRCARCRGRGWFDAVTAPGGLGPLVAAAEVLHSGAAQNLLVRPALPWERFPIPPELRAGGNGPAPDLWERAVRASAVILYEHADRSPSLAGGLELARLAETHTLVRELFWDALPGGGRWRCMDRHLAEFHLRLQFFRAWRGEWLDVAVDRPEPPPPPPPGPAEITGAAQKYITGKMFVGVPEEET